MNPLKQILKYSLGLVLPDNRFLLNGPRSTRDIALTFDDGPDPNHTRELLDLLKSLGIRGSFFVTGERAAESPHLIERIVTEGHSLGHHSWSHGEPDETSARQLADEVEQTRRLLEKIVGVRSNLFRPPKGKLSISKFRELWRLNQTIVLWNIDPRDYSVAPGESLDAWVQSYQPTAGDILLFHDIHPHCRRAIARLAEKDEFRRDWKFTTIGDWLPNQLTGLSVVDGCRPLCEEVALPCR